MLVHHGEIDAPTASRLCQRRLIHELRDEGLVVIDGIRPRRQIPPRSPEDRWSVTGNMIEYSRNSTGTGVPARINRRKCARIAINSISRALLAVNETEMQFCAVLQTFSPRNANEMREMLALRAGLFRRAGIANALPLWRSTVPL